MTTTDLSNYKTLYLQTAKENINKMSRSLDKLANDVLDLDSLNNLHISSHSLKSKSQVMGFVNMANLCAAIEKISNSALKGENKINNNLIVVLKESIAKLNLQLAQIEKGDAETSSA